MSQTNIGGVALGDIVLGQGVDDPFTQHVTSTYVPTQTQTALQQKPYNSTSTYTPTQAIVCNKSYARTVISNLNLSHIRAFNSVISKSVTHTLPITHTVLGSYCHVVTSNLNLTQTIAYTMNKHIQHNLNCGQQVSLNCNYVRSVNTIFPVYQTISYHSILHQSVTSTLNLSQTVTAPKVKGVSQTLALSQSVVGVASKSVKNTIVYTQEISYNQVHNVTVAQNIGLTSTVLPTRSFSLRVHHGFGLNSFVRKSKVVSPTVASVLSLVQQIRFSVYARTVSQNLTLAQTVLGQPVYPRTVGNILTLTQTIDVQKVYARSIESQLVFLPVHQVYIGMGGIDYYIIDNIQYAHIPAYQTRKPHCILQTANSVITLPSPNWGDGEGYDGLFTIRRSMTGVPYTYVRSLSLRKLKLPWSLAKRKAWELREFLLQNNAKLMTLTTWKGDKWFVNLTTNPFELNVRGRYDAENEKVDIELEFEGLKVT